MSVSMSDRLLPPNHERRLLTTFRYIDELISQAVSRLEPASTASPLSEFAPDARPDQQKMAAEYLDRLRELMRRFLDKHQIPPPERNVSVLWAAHTACRHARVSVEELRAADMRGYGKVSPEAAQELETLVACLADVLQKMGEYLEQAAAQDG
jgi:hypothetical protein